VSDRGMRQTLGQSYVRTFAPDAATRSVDDFYPTPQEMTEALLSVEKFTGGIWEPACGDGAMSRVLLAAGYNVFSSDLIDRGYGLGGVDFLKSSRARNFNVVTNPPYKLIEPFIHRSLENASRKVALLGRLALLEGQGRRETIWNQTPLARVWVFSKRIACVKPGDPEYGTKGGKGGMIAYAWFVWDHEHVGKPTLGWI